MTGFEIAKLPTPRAVSEGAGPMIETERLTLRPYEAWDFAAFEALVGDAAFLSLFDGRPMSREDAWHRFLRYAGHWALFDHGLFSIFERVSGRHVGETGLADFHRGLGPDFDTAPEAAWIVSSEHHGKGYASEAASAVHDWFDRTRGTIRTVCIIRPDNAGSLRVAERVGYRRFGSTVYREKAFEMLERVAG